MKYKSLIITRLTWFFPIRTGGGEKKKTCPKKNMERLPETLENYCSRPQNKVLESKNVKK